MRKRFPYILLSAAAILLLGCGALEEKGECIRGHFQPMPVWVGKVQVMQMLYICDEREELGE